MGRMGYDRGDAGGGNGTPQQKAQAAVARLVAVLNSPNASSAQKAVAAQQAVQIAQQYGGAAIAALQQAGWGIKGSGPNAQLIYLATGQAQTPTDGIEGKRGQWAQATQAALAAPANAARMQMSGAGGDTGGQNRTRFADATGGTGQVDWSALGNGENANTFNSGGTGNPADLNGGDFNGTFFGNLDPNSLDELAGDPNSAWSVFKTQGGPGGSSLQNSMLGRFGENNFKSLMGLAPYLNGEGSGPGNTLDFADKGMRQNMQGGGNYMDPGKILNAVFSRIGSDTSVANQETEIQKALADVEPFMDPTQYRMMQNRVNDVLDQYLTYGLSNQGSSADLSGVLLKALHQAIGM